jgi:hypothetical protein
MDAIRLFIVVSTLFKKPLRCGDREKSEIQQVHRSLIISIIPWDHNRDIPLWLIVLSAYHAIPFVLEY